MFRSPFLLPRQRRALWALGFYAAATALLTAPLPLYVFSTVARAVRQDVWLNVWALAWTSEHLLTAPAGLFDANIFFPHVHTLAYGDHFIGEALLAAPVYELGGGAVLAYNVAWFAALVLTGWGGYLWVRSLIGDEPAGEAAALVAGAVCLLVPGKRTALSHLQVISLQGVTLTLFAVHLLLRRATWKRAAALAAATTYAALSSWYTAAYVGLLLPLVGGAGLLVAAPGRPRRRAAVYGMGAVLLAVLILYPVALPYRSVQLEMQFERPVDELVATSLAPVDFVSSWSWLHTGWMPGGSGAGGYFPGFLALALAVIGLDQSRRRKDPWPLIYAGAAVFFAVLALGPRLTVSEGYQLPLPYELLFRFVPGFGALRNPYRAAFIGTILLAAPVGYGARAVIEGLRGRLLRRQRWRVHPRLRALPPATWVMAVVLAGVHLGEAWPGPQEIAPLPAPPSAAYAWLAREHPGAAALVVPLPRPFDDNARYQLWTVGAWVPLANGHSGIYPADFLELYRAGAEFPEARFMQHLKERFPVRFVVAHYGLDERGAATRAAAAEAGLEVAWQQGDDVVYAVGNGAPGGWARRRLPARMVGDRVVVDAPGGAAGCGFRVLIDGRLAGEAAGPAGTDAPEGAAASAHTYSIELNEPAVASWQAVLEMYTVNDEGLPRIDLHARMSPARRASLVLNGVPYLEAPAVVALVDGSSGRLAFARGVAADAAGAGGAVREAMASASPDDELLVAVAEDLDYGLIERLALLLDRAGGVVREGELEERGTTYAFRGLIGAPAGSGLEMFGDDGADLIEDDAEDDCRLAPIVRFEMQGMVPTGDRRR